MYVNIRREAIFSGSQWHEQEAQTEMQHGLSEHQETYFY